MANYRPRNQRAAEAREDVDLLKMALAQMWPVSAEQRAQLIDRQMEIVTDPLLPSNVKSEAARNVLAAGIANLKAIETVIKLGLAQATVKTVTHLASDEEMQEGLQKFLTPSAPQIGEGG